MPDNSLYPVSSTVYPSATVASVYVILSPTLRTSVSICAQRVRPRLLSSGQIETRNYFYCLFG